MENEKPWLFKKGQSGNPSGRPKGAKINWFSDLVGDRKEKLAEKLIKMAEKGNPKAMDLVFNRLVPALPSESPFNIEKLSGSCVEQVDSLFKALEENQVTPSQAKIITDMIAIKSKLVDQELIIKRLESLEQKMQK